MKIYFNLSNNNVTHMTGIIQNNGSIIIKTRVWVVFNADT